MNTKFYRLNKQNKKYFVYQETNSSLNKNLQPSPHTVNIFKTDDIIYLTKANTPKMVFGICLKGQYGLVLIEEPEDGRIF